ncbi:MAG TPA: hypothetical protein VHE56_06855, partial [Mycobacteriales bacterium]|nr:hypothetical protein [Mycobacteriales bacterium]
MRGRLGITRAAAVGVVLVGAAFATPAAAVQVGNAVALHPGVGSAQHVAKAVPLRVDRAGYVAATPLDPYRGDAQAIHVSMAAGQELTRGYFHVSLHHLPAGAKLSTLRVTVPAVVGSPIAGASLTVAQPIIEACVLSKPLPASTAAGSPPAYDCAKGSAVGKPIEGGARWSFALKSLARYWARHDNTGAALVPIASTPAATWSAGFSIKGIRATVIRSVSAPTGLPA